MEGDLQKDLDDILNLIYLSPSIQPEHLNYIIQYLCTHEDESIQAETVDMFLALLASRTDLRARKKLRNTLVLMAKEQPRVACILFDRLHKNTAKLKVMVATESLAKTVLCYAKLFNVVRWDDVADDQSRKRLIESQTIICSFYAKLQNRKYYDRNYHCLEKYLTKLSPESLEKYHVLLKELSTSLDFVILWDNVVGFETKTNQHSLLDKYKGFVIDLFVKNVILSKVKLSEQYGTFCFRNTLSQITKDEFRTTLFPSMQKAILRNPEISLGLMIFIIEYLNFDLSEHLEDMSKLLGGHLHSKNETLQDESLKAVKVVAQKCSDAGMIEFAIGYFAQIYHGSEGKLTVLNQKHTVIKSIGALSFPKVESIELRQRLMDRAIEELLKIFKLETVETSFILIFTQIKLWIENSPRCILPEPYWKFFKEFSKSKSATSNTLAVAYECFISLFNFDDDEMNSKHASRFQNDDLLSLLVISSKNLTSPLTKFQTLIESLHASLVLLKIYKINQDSGERIKNFLASLRNFGSMTILEEKFITQAPGESLLYLKDFVFHCIRYMKFGPDDLNILHQACLYLMCSRSLEVRTKTAAEFMEYCSEDQTFPAKLIAIANKIFGGESDLSEQNEKLVLKCCQTLINQCRVDDRGGPSQIIFDILQLCHLPTIYSQNTDLFFEFLCKNLSHNTISKLVEEKFDLFVGLVFKSSTVGQNSVSTLNIVRTLTKLQPHKFVSYFVLRIAEDLDKHLTEFRSVSQTDYEIFRTPDGQLYNRTPVMEAATVQEDKNLKRESKLYSHKEQLAEIELRKELEAKRKNDTLDLTKLNKKQKEIYAQEMEKEKIIRNRLKFLNDQFRFYTNILHSIIDTSPVVASVHFKEIIFTYVNLFSSVLTFEPATAFFKQISHKMMMSDRTRKDGEYTKYVDIICNAIIRLYRSGGGGSKPDAQSVKLVVRIVDYIYHRTCPGGDDCYDEKLVKQANKNRLTTPAFSFAFPIFRFVLLNMDTNCCNDYEKLVEKCLRIIGEHALMRCYAEDDLGNLKNPQNLPIKSILDTLLRFMERDAAVNCDQLAANTLIKVATSVNNEMGCGKATTRDIFILLNYLTHPNDLIRSACYEALAILASNVLPFIQDEHCRQKLIRRCFVGKFDKVTACQINANAIFKSCQLEVSPTMLDVILTEDIEIINLVMARPVAEAYKTLLEQFPAEVEQCYEKLTKFYRIKASASIPSVDSFGRPLSKTHVDHYEPRLTVAFIFRDIVHLFGQTQVESFINFLIPEALSDNNESVRSAMLDAGCQLIDVHGKDNINYFLNVFESFLDRAPDDHHNDVVRKSVIVLMGTLAKHIDSENPKLKPILSKLVEALSTPSQIVQEAVANCLQYLIPKFKDDAPALLQKLLEFLFESEIYGERKGAAYGIAGIVKGLGILSINKLGIMDALTQAIQAKDKPNNREGALFAFEMLSHMLGRLFEPYIVHILPYLLDCFGDSSTRVRQAADDTAKVIMSNLSAYGVTLIYPAILTALEDDSWRKKTSSIDLLGSMAFCAPKQLSQCLPKIVPKLMAVITDSHPKVQRSAAQALKQIGSVIKNPEIQEIVPILLEALQDPANKTNECLNVMMRMKFVHVIDPPSLALIMPVIERAFQNRSTETRKMAAQIIGNMYALTKSKDLLPYLPSIIPGLKNSLLDPVPEVRTATARALGVMVRSLGNEILNDLRPWLEKMLISEASSVDRSGAAQGLAEVLGGLGKEHLDRYMPKILEVTESPDVPPYVKDGFIMLYIYLPSVFTQHFKSYISQVINPILKALADENEFVRETALRAGQRIVHMYAETTIQLLLPELEKGLFDENWRIRFSSVQLLGDLLFKITGFSNKMTTETINEDENFGTEQSHQALFVTLGEERHNRVLSGLYMGRSDVAIQVRHASLHVWKVIVPNTPRTLKEILPVLFTLLLECLASNSSDRQQIGARTLGDLVRKLGDRILPEIIPILEEGLRSERPDQRQGVCIGLSEIIASTGREMVLAYADSFISTVRKALFDTLPEVRMAAARTFDNLHSAIGEKCLTDIMTHLLDNIDHPEKGERVLDSLKNIISYKSRVVLPNLIPKLITKPVNTRALAFISSVAGESLSKHLHTIIPPLLTALSESFDTPDYNQQLEYCQNIIISVTDETGARTVILTLLESSKFRNLYLKRAAVTLLVHYCVQSKPWIISDFRSQLITNLIDLMASNDEYILNQCVEALNSITKNMDNKQQLETVPEVYKRLQITLSDFDSGHHGVLEGTPFPGFASNKGIQALLGLFNKALLSSTIDLKEQGANGYRLIVKHASAEALKPSAMSITGPLLRILSDRLAPEVKIIAIDILSILLSKVGLHLKPFFPQIQLIFLRSLIEGDRSVRLQAAICIGRFSRVHTKPDSFAMELLNVVKNCHHEALFLKETGYYAIRLAVSAIGDKLSPQILQQIYDIVSGEYGTANDTIRVPAASCLGTLCPYASPELLEEIGQRYLMDQFVNETNFRWFRSIVLKVALKDAFEKLIMANEEWSAQIHAAILSYIGSNEYYIIVEGLKCAAYVIHHSLNRDIMPDKNLLKVYAKSLNQPANEIKQTLISSVIFWAQNKPDIPVPLLKAIVPMLVNGTKERNSMVRAYSEQALVLLLKLKDRGSDDESPVYQKCLSQLGSGAVEALQDCVAKIKKNIAKIDFKEEEFDDTLIL